MVIVHFLYVAQLHWTACQLIPGVGLQQVISSTVRYRCFSVLEDAISSPGLWVTENPLFIHLVGRLTLMNIGFLEIDTGDNSRSWSGEKEDKFPFLSSLTNNGAFHGNVLNEKGMQNIWTENVDLKNHPWMSSYVEVSSFQSWRPSDFGKQLESLYFQYFFSLRYFNLFSQVGLKCFPFKRKYSNIPFLPICTELVSWWGKLMPKAFLYSGLSVS